MYFVICGLDEGKTCIGLDEALACAREMAKGNEEAVVMGFCGEVIECFPARHGK